MSGRIRPTWRVETISPYWLQDKDSELPEESSASRSPALPHEKIYEQEAEGEVCVSVRGGGYCVLQLQQQWGARDSAVIYALFGTNNAF